MIEHVKGFRDELQADSFAKVLGTIKHVDANTTLIVFSDHGIKLLPRVGFRGLRCWPSETKKPQLGRWGLAFCVAFFRTRHSLPAKALRITCRAASAR